MHAIQHFYHEFTSWYDMNTFLDLRKRDEYDL
jgi:hypothetical protein